MTQRTNILSFDDAKTQGASRRSVRGAAASGSAGRTSRRSVRTEASLGKHASGQMGRASREAAHGRHASASRTPSWYSADDQTAARSRTAADRGARPGMVSSEDCEPRSEKRKETPLAAFKRTFRAAKAERQFERTVGRQEARAAQQARSEGGSRAAVYEMEMGRSHKRSSRMQNEGRSGFTNPLALIAGALSGFAEAVVAGGRARHVAVGAFVVLFMCGMLYGPTSEYYNEVRSLQRLEVQHEVLSEYYAQVKSDVDYLSTEEGMADYVHEQLGWVRYDEHSVNVEGLSESAADPSEATTANAIQNLSLGAADVQAPDTWYSGVLDAVFGYES